MPLSLSALSNGFGVRSAYFDFSSGTSTRFIFHGFKVS
jgi:hypothetical protein